MNKIWLKSLQFHQKSLYPGEPTIDIDQLLRAMKIVQGQQQDLNGFASYSIKNPSDEKKEEVNDVISFEQFTDRIEATYKDTKDNIYIDTFFNLIDTDKDELISYQDLISMKSELGLEECPMSEKSFDEFAQKLNHETTKIGKKQFVDIIRQYI